MSKRTRKHTHTPGPWTIDAEGNVVVDGDARATIAWVSSPDSFENGDEPMMANARLIAAAPKLLAALKRLSAGMNSEFDSTPRVKAVEVQAARAAIAEAEEH